VCPVAAALPPRGVRLPAAGARSVRGVRPATVRQRARRWRRMPAGSALTRVRRAQAHAARRVRVVALSSGGDKPAGRSAAPPALRAAADAASGAAAASNEDATPATQLGGGNGAPRDR
jgi:hypothetical protein